MLMTLRDAERGGPDDVVDGRNQQLVEDCERDELGVEIEGRR